MASCDESLRELSGQLPPPEFQSLTGSGFTAHVAGFEAHAVHHGHVNSVGDGVGTLDRAPGIVLRHSELGFLRGMPANGCRIEQRNCTLQCGKTSALGIPLIPADERAEASRGSVKRTKAEIAGSEIKFFVIERIIGNVHLSIEPAQGTIGIEDGGGVMVDAGRTLLEK